MSSRTLVDQIRHYQKDIERCPDNSERNSNKMNPHHRVVLPRDPSRTEDDIVIIYKMMRCIKRLYVMPILVEHLQETGVGRSVNALRKYSGEVGDAAKALVAKWKAMVAAQEEEEEAAAAAAVRRSDEEAEEAESEDEVSETKNSHRHYEKKVNHQESGDKKKSGHHHSHHHSVGSTGTAAREDHDKKRRERGGGDGDNDKKRRHHPEVTPEKLPPSSNSSGTDRKRKRDEERHSGDGSKHRKVIKQESPPPQSEHEDSDDEDRMERLSSGDEEEEDNDEGQEEASDSDNSNSDKNRDNEDEEASNSDSSEDRSRRNHRSKTSKKSSDRHRKSSEKSSSHHHHHNGKLSKSDRHKSSHHHHHKSSSSSKDRHKSRDESSKKKRSSSTEVGGDMEKLIKENEKKIKKEKVDKPIKKETSTGQSGKNTEKLLKAVKIEKNEDGSIDAGSGASFAEALMQMDTSSKSGKKKKKSASSPSTAAPSVGGGKSKNQHSSSSTNNASSKTSKNSSSGVKALSSSSNSSSPSAADLTKMPDLLTKKVKLESLNLDISSTLPEISLNYKPLPHVPENTRRAKTSMTEEEAMSSIMTTKYQRTKVFSGNKTGVYASVPSLYSLCIQLLYENIDAVEYTGGVPYDILKPLLEKLNADQLYVLEHHNAYLIEDTDFLWQFHCKKDFRSETRQDMESWRDLYLRCMDERERKLKALTANITQSIAKSTPVRQAKLAYVDTIVKPPRNVARSQARYGTGPGLTNNKHEILKKAAVGAHTPGITATDVVPPPPPSASHSSSSSHSSRTPTIMKKKKAPLMAKALQLIKGNRFKR